LEERNIDRSDRVRSSWAVGCFCLEDDDDEWAFGLYVEDERRAREAYLSYGPEISRVQLVHEPMTQTWRR
jgi:hypothetical protein